MQSAESKPPRSKPRVVLSTLEIQQLLGTMLLKERLVTAVDLSTVQEKLLNSGDSMPLLYCLSELKIVDEKRILNCIRRYQPDVPIGALLVKLQYLAPENLARAVIMQGEANLVRKLGQILLDNNWVEPNDLGKALAAQSGFEFIDPTFAEPTNQEARTAVARALCSVIVPVMCAEPCIENQLDLHSRKVDPFVSESDEDKDVNLLDLIQTAITNGASDIHIEPLKSNGRIGLRIDGLLRTERDITHEQRRTIIANIKNLAELDSGECSRYQSGHFTHTPTKGDHPFKMQCYFFVTEQGESAVMRLNSRRDDVMKLAKLGIFESILNQFKEHTLEAPSGSIILTGPDGSGKTSTLYS